MSQVINLQKKQVINLSKHKPGLSRVCVGVNWGQVLREQNVGGFLGFGSRTEMKPTPVDLDISAGLLDASGSPVHSPVCYYNHDEPGLHHSGDDLEGDIVNDGIDNEVIEIDFSRVSANVSHIPVVLNDFRRELKNFGELPHLEIRIYEGTPTRVDNVIATFNIKNNEDLNNAQAVVLGNFSRVNGEFQFEAIGKSEPNTRLEDLIQRGFKIASK